MKLWPSMVSCLALTGASGVACAQGFEWNTAGAASMGMGGVYLPSEDSAAGALAANPAGLSMLGRRTVDLNVAGLFASGSFRNSANPNAPLESGPGAIPYGAFGMPVPHSRFSIGVGIVPEMASTSNWNYADSPGVAGANYGDQREKSEIIAGRAVAAVSYALTRKISLGVSAGAVYNSNTLETVYPFQSNPSLAGLKTLLNLHTQGFGESFGAGIVANPTDRTEVNAAWKSRSVVNSTGSAEGNIGVQLAALGLGGARPDFRYDADVRTVLPQSVLAGISRRADHGWIFAFEADWVNWKSAFASLPVSLTNGNNADINGLLGSNAVFDRVPLDWKDQYWFRGGVEKSVTEAISVRAGYAHSNNPVPGSTLSPLTAAIMTNQFSAGAGYRRGHWRFDLGYGIDPTARANVGNTALLGGQYGNSSVRIGTQALELDTSFWF